MPIERYNGNSYDELLIEKYDNDSWQEQIVELFTGGSWASLSTIVEYVGPIADGGSVWWVRPAGETYGDSNGTSYTSAVSGNDGLANIAENISPGDAIAIAGTHKEVIEVPTSGDSTNPIYISGLIDGDVGGFDGRGFVPEEDWEIYNGDIYKAKIKDSDIAYLQEDEPSSPSIGEKWLSFKAFTDPSFSTGTAREWDGSQWTRPKSWFHRPYLVLSDETLQTCARYPVDSYHSTFDTADYLSLTHSAGIGGKNDNYWAGGEISIRSLPWLRSYSYITSSSGDTVNFHSLTDFINYHQLDDGCEYYIENIVGQITNSGDWAYKNGYLYINKNGISNVSYSYLANGIFNDGNSYVTIDNLTFEYMNDIPIFSVHGSNIDVKNCTVSKSHVSGVYHNQATAAITVWGYFPWELSGSTRDGTKTDQLNNGNIYNNTVSDIYTGVSAICAYAMNGGKINDNNISQIGNQGNSLRGRPNGIFAQFNSYIDMLRNDIRNIPYAGIINTSDNTTCEDNFFRGVGTYLHDTGGIYTYGAITNNCVFRRNTIENVHGYNIGCITSLPCSGVYLDELTKGTIVEENVIYNCVGDPEEGAIILHKTENCSVLNNDIYDDDHVLVYEKNIFTDTNTISGNTRYDESSYVSPKN